MHERMTAHERKLGQVIGLVQLQLHAGDHGVSDLNRRMVSAQQ